MKKNTKIAEMFGSMTPEQIRAFLATLSPAEAWAIMDDWSLWSMPHQRMPEGEWTRWVCRAGRASGKSYMAARTLHEIARDPKKIGSGEMAIIAVTYGNARKCVEDPASGVLAVSPSDFRPQWEPGKGKLTWPNGVVCRIFSADRPDSLRGNNWSFVWADEVAFWPNVSQTWHEVVVPAIRQGWSRSLLTTTPKPGPFLRDLEKLPGTIVTRASTYENRFLKKSTLEAWKAHYEGTRSGKQEMLGEFLELNPDALWTLDLLHKDRIREEDFDASILTKVVVAVDPATTSSEESDETGIVVAGQDSKGHCYVLEDLSFRGKPHEWADAAIQAYHNWKANYIIAETNQGGDMVENVLRNIDYKIAYKSVHAKKSKILRAEPVSTAYEKHKVSHVGVFELLETQQTDWSPGKPSPDRIDALVYALTELLDSEKPGLSAEQLYGLGAGFRHNNIRRR